MTRLCEYWRYHREEGFLSGVNGSLASPLRHITICNTKLAVKLCQFFVKFHRIVSNETETNEFFSVLHFVRHTSERHAMNDARSLHRLPISAWKYAH